MYPGWNLTQDLLIMRRLRRYHQTMAASQLLRVLSPIFELIEMFCLLRKTVKANQHILSSFSTKVINNLRNILFKKLGYFQNGLKSVMTRTIQRITNIENIDASAT